MPPPPIQNPALLVAFGGLPGSGKTTLAQALARRYAAVYIRIDTIEQTLRSRDVLRDDVGPAGYLIAYQIAGENLSLGQTVVADSVNALQLTRDSWAEIARENLATLVEVEVICSDSAEHRRRIEHRQTVLASPPGLTWAAVTSRRYEPWTTPHLVIDTAHRSIPEADEELNRLLAEWSRSSTRSEA